MSERPKTYGLEVEHILVGVDGSPYPLRDKEFKRIKELLGQGDLHSSRVNGTEHVVGVVNEELGELGLDAAMSLAEIAVKHTDSQDGGLHTLSKRALEGISVTNKAVMELTNSEAPPSISMSMNPLAPRDMDTYRRLVTPKPVYEIIWRRGWKHNAGIHCAHTSPWTSVEMGDAVDALNVTIAFGGPIIATFGNSPFGEGGVSGYKETRQTMWPMLLGESEFPDDAKLVGMPKEKPRSLSHYFQLMGVVPVLVVTAANTNDYKTSGLYTVEDNPSIIEFLSRDKWTAFELGNPELPKIQVNPSVDHFALNQFMQFWGARIRFGLQENHGLNPGDLHQAITENKLEQFLEPHLTMLCIEARDYGTALPNKMEPSVNVLSAPPAMQAGLIANLRKAKDLADRYQWGFWWQVRDVAVKKGLEGEVDGIKILDLARDIVCIAAEGLSSSDQPLVQPAIDIVRNGKSRADAMLDEFERRRNNTDDASVVRGIMEERRLLRNLVK